MPTRERKRKAAARAAARRLAAVRAVQEHNQAICERYTEAERARILREPLELPWLDEIDRRQGWARQ